jgi:palmitoyltransferase
MGSLYHFYNLLGNSTTIEGWEKDKVATLVRRGKISEVSVYSSRHPPSPLLTDDHFPLCAFLQIKFPYNLGLRRNITSILGDNPLMWCCPTVTPGTGLKYQLANGDGKWIEFAGKNRGGKREDEREA